MEEVTYSSACGLIYRDKLPIPTYHRGTQRNQCQRSVDLIKQSDAGTKRVLESQSYGNLVEEEESTKRKLHEVWENESLEVLQRIKCTSVGVPESTDTPIFCHFCSVAFQQVHVIHQAGDTGLLRHNTMSYEHNLNAQHSGSKLWQRTKEEREDTNQICKVQDFALPEDPSRSSENKPRLKLNNSGTLPSVLKVPEQFDPWLDWAYAWFLPDVHQTRICVRSSDDPNSVLFMRLITPTALYPVPEQITLSWDNETILSLSFGESERALGVTADTIEILREITALYVGAPRPHPVGPGRDFVTLFGPDVPYAGLKDWLERNLGSESALQAYSRGRTEAAMGVVRDFTRNREPLRFRRWRFSDDQTAPVPELECERIPHRKNPLCSRLEPKKSSKIRVVPLDACTVDKLPYRDSMFGLLIPVIVDKLESMLIAARLCNTILKDIGFKSLSHVVRAITTPCARPDTHYQRYEFFGDSVLKYTVSCQLFFQHPDWREGELSNGRDGLVRNPRLTRAALSVGLDAFVINRVFNVRKWSAPLVSQKLKDVALKQDLSAKVLADVVEALIGAAYIDGGPSQAQACIQRLLPEIKLQPLCTQSVVQASMRLYSGHFVDDRLKENLGYTFKTEALLTEALTHPSSQSQGITQSYQRLEFLGDAILDMIIVDTLISHPSEITPGEMTLVKHAASNANLLAFLCMEYTVASNESSTTPEEIKEPAETTSPSGLWRFMHFTNPSIRISQKAVLGRYHLLRGQIISGLQQGTEYPWQALCQLNADKHFSDIVESVLGAIFVDSNGDLCACKQFVERIGLLQYLQRILRDGVNVAHPKNIVQMLSKSQAQFKLDILNNGTSDAAYQCTVSLNGAQIALVEDCLCRDEAEVKAAYATIDYLQQDRVITGQGCTIRGG